MNPNKVENKFYCNKAKMAVDRRKIMAQLIELRDEARRLGFKDARLTAEDHIKQARSARTENDWLDLQAATYYIDEMLHAKPGGKVTFSAWDRSDDRDADYVIKAMKELDLKCSNKRHEIFDVETKIITRAIALATAAKAEKNREYLRAAMNMASKADNVRRSFSRSGGKAKFAWQPEIQKKVRLLKANVDATELRLREALKTGRWSQAASICRNIGSMYSGPNGLASYYEQLQTVADEEWKSKNARFGAKAKFENPMDIEMLWTRQSNGDWAAVLWDVKAKRKVRTVRTFKSEREAKDFVNAWWQKNRPIG